MEILNQAKFYILDLLGPHALEGHVLKDNSVHRTFNDQRVSLLFHARSNEGHRCVQFVNLSYL